ncbi:MAG: sigma-54-dependent Fis family transcriptional regulator [Balneola sp.]|nr:sigma-54-dependent Fis family transcriptional regulator [Balneola sp.]MBO6650927.1 sigma-54-dependent Fis family transcriptional regulator [Balneola sp.]MBO6711869.1 sigma-54-dependent Fis family transcriptional regulator [Balneola sp.]MBO6800064.1 sigma-54-dependent Fis family transcriptional regulator [Balneola sp.]MBO6871555.1 sigma-54-dependent Fis family transcriptional regulator [Balneola sp.]
MERKQIKYTKGKKSPEFIANDKSMKDLCYKIDKIATTDATVLITGESGTGKEVVSRLIHHKSKRKDQPFVALNCGAISKDLVESELFGHEKGAFTGATEKKEGCFEQASGGTIFLDEIGEMELDMQVKLLRAVEQRSFRRVGGKEEIKTDVRIVAATNCNLKKAIEEGDFRKDLYYRLCVIELEIPPLRERRSDIIELADFYLKKFIKKHECEPKYFTNECGNYLRNYMWPGNVRELRNTIERTVIMCMDKEISSKFLPSEILEDCSCDEAFSDSKLNIKNPIPGSQVKIPLGISMEEAEKMLIDRTLLSVDNNKSEAAKILGFSRKTLHNKLNKYENQY